MTAASRQAFVGVGSNLGDREANIRQAVEHLRAEPEVCHLHLSPLYETPPVGVTDQPHFLNGVIGVETTLSPAALLKALLDIERRMGRVRRERWGPRLIDLDLLLYEEESRHNENLILPHPRFRERPFVTIPLLDLLAEPEYDRAAWQDLVAKLEPHPRDPSVRRWEP